MKKVLISLLVTVVTTTAIKSQTYLSTSGGTLTGNLALNGSLSGTYTPTVTGPYQINTWNHYPVMSNNSLYTSLRLYTAVQPSSTGNNTAGGLDIRLINQQTSLNTGGNFNPVSSTFYDQSGGFASNINVTNYRAYMGTLPVGSTIRTYIMYGGSTGPTAVGGTITNFTGFDLSFPYSNATTNFYGARINDISGATIARAYSSDMMAGTGKYGLYFSGTASNYLSGSLGIGTTTPANKLEINQGGLGLTSGTSTVTGGYSSIAINTTGSNTSAGYSEIQGLYAGVSNSAPLVLQRQGGSVLIGKTALNSGATYLLDVAGDVRANKLTVNTTGADFVFEPSYTLKSLKELESFVLQNHHLPDVEPAVEMQKHGVNVGDNQTKLLQKIEELTLYLINQNKTISEQQASIEILKKKVEKMERINKFRIISMSKGNI